MAYLTSISTSALNGQNINAELLIHTWTNNTRVRKVFINVFAKDIIGGGDYKVHLTWDRAGVGTFYESIKTTKTVAAGVTTTCFESIPLVVDAVGVVRVYLLGLAGDNVNAVDTIVDIYEEFVATDTSGYIYLAPTQGGVAFAGQVSITANVAGEGALHVVNANAGGIGTYNSGMFAVHNNGTLVGQRNTGDTGQHNEGTTQGQHNQGGDYGQYNEGDTGQYNNGTLNAGVKADGAQNGIEATGTAGYGLQAAGGTNETDIGLCDVWLCTPRTLTSSGTVTVVSVVNGDKITVRPYSTWVINVNDVGSLVGRTSLWFGVKDDPALQADTASFLQVEETAGLQYINGAVGVGANATLVVTDPVAGDFTVTVNKSQTGVPPCDGRIWQLKVGIAGGADTVIAEGEFNVGQTVTRTTA